MEDFLNYLIPQLVDQQEKLSISKTEENGNFIFTINCAKEDMGKIIGKEGKVINSLRNLLKIIAVKEKKHVILQLAEPTE